MICVISVKCAHAEYWNPHPIHKITDGKAGGGPKSCEVIIIK